MNARFARMLREENASAQAAVESGELQSTTEEHVSTMQNLAGSYETLPQVAGRLRSAMSPEQRMEFSDKMAELRQQLQEEATP